ncbi:MAG: anti-sigma factor, partial [Rubrobacter sp.]
MSEMDHERFEDLKDAYVLDALPEEERRDFEDYLAAHPERQAEVDELGAVAGLLAFSPHEQEPPPELRARLMEVVEREAEPRREQRRSLWSSIADYLGMRSLALGAAALLVIGLFSWNVLLQGQVQDLQGKVEDEQAQVQDLQGQVQDAQAQRQVQQSQTIELAGSWADQGAEAEVASINENRVILVADNMPSVPDDKTCQVWVINDDVPQPSGLFQPDGNMTATPITHPIEEADTVAVTVE